jgi:hypothetical protein
MVVVVVVVVSVPVYFKASSLSQLTSTLERALCDIETNIDTIVHHQYDGLVPEHTFSGPGLL